MSVEVTVKLFGTLDRWVSAYDPETGCSMHLPDSTTVAQLIDRLGIPRKSVGFVSVDGRVAGQGDVLPDRALVKVFHPIFGG